MSNDHKSTSFAAGPAGGCQASGEVPHSAPAQWLSGNEAGSTLDAVAGRPTSAGDTYVGKRCWDRDGAIAGTVTNTGVCRLAGCRGTALHVKWPDGRRTFPCAKGCVLRDDGDLQIR